MRIGFRGLLIATLLVFPGSVLAHASLDADGFGGPHTHDENSGDVITATGEVVSIPDYDALLNQARERGDVSVASGPGLTDSLLERGEELLFGDLNSLPPGSEELPLRRTERTYDADLDGISDGDEVRLGTNSTDYDSDDDGYLDGLEIVRGYNPTVASPEDKVTHAWPDDDLPETLTYQVTNVRMIAEESDLFLTVLGVAPAYSVVAIYVEGNDELQTWFVRADASGRYRYVSADVLSPGEYRVRAAGASANGVPDEASATVTIERTNDEVRVIDEVQDIIPDLEVSAVDPLSDLWQRYSRIGLLVVIAVIVAGSVMVYMILRRRREH